MESSLYPLYSLADMGVIVLDCEHKTPQPVANGYPYIAIPNVRDGRLDLSDVRLISKEDLDLWNRRTKPQAGDIVLTRRARVGDTAVIPSKLQCALGQNLVILRSDEKYLLQDFLRWLVRGPEYWDQVFKYQNEGAVFSSLNVRDIPRFEFSIPPLPIQRRIAAILGRLDDKIEVNRRSNRTLEAMAQALYRHWFVDFGPFQAGEFVESALGLIPAGWTTTTLKEITTKIGSGATPRGGSSVYIDEGINLIRSQNVYDSAFSWDGLAHITDDAAERLRTVTVEAGDVLINITGDSILRTCVADEAVLPARVNQHVAIIRPIAEVPPNFVHQHLLRPETKEMLFNMSAGATRKAITKGNLEETPILLPPTVVLEAFRRKTDPFFAQIAINNRESRKLAEIRDYLLPKLLSGEIGVAAEFS